MARTLRKRPRNAAVVKREAGIYSRVSVIDPRLSKDDVESIESQDEECREACEANRWPIYREYSDPGISASEYAKDKVRPDWDQLVGDIEAGLVRVAVMWESSRGDRKPEEWLGFLNLCRRVDCLIHIMNHDEDNGGVTYDMSNADHFDKLAREGLDNARESHKTSGRLRRLKRRRRAKGLPDGRCPYGYRRVYNPDTGKIVAQEPDYDETGQVVWEVFHRLAASDTQVVVVKDLNARGVASATNSASGWAPSTIRGMVKRKAYISIIEHDGEEFEARWRPALYVPGQHQQWCGDVPLSDGRPCPGCEPDEALFYKVQKLFADRALNGTRPGKAKHELSSIAECGVCSNVMGHINGGVRNVR